MGFPSFVTQERLDHFLINALREDLGDGDHSTLASVPEKKQSKAVLIIKEKGILAGVALAKHLFNSYDQSLKFKAYYDDGDHVSNTDQGFEVEGNARSILSLERLVLNCMQRMSGIATFTHSMVEMIEGTGCQLLDTRKTTPNFRMMEKWAVLIGGGNNHRFGLYDMIMLKDNHNDMAGGITKALTSTRDYLKKNGLELKIEVETRNLNEVKEVLEAGCADFILLDNMDIETLKAALTLIDGRIKTEASGGITQKNLREIALTGVDFISMGALTHSAPVMDMSLKAVI